MSDETGNQVQIRLAFARLLHQLWRNNSGAFQDVKGRWVRYGLANDSKQLNEDIKSSDLIGCTTVVITPEMVGKRVAIFTAVETKKTDWKFSLNDDRAVAQNKFHGLVREAGGIAGFARTAEEALWLVTEWLRSKCGAK